MRVDVIKITGLKEFSRGLRKMDKDLPKGLRLAANTAANVVVDAAKPKVPLGPGKGGHARTSIKAASTRTAARVSAGGTKFSYYPWLDFGGAVGRNNSVKRPFLKSGRYIYPAYKAHKDQFQGVLYDELVKVAANAGLGVDDGG